VQNNFLNGPGTVLSNDAHGMFSYLWTPRTSISFGPTYVYEYSTGALASGAEATGTYVGGQVSLSHSLSPLSSVIFTYQAERSSFSNTSTVAGPPPGTAILQDFTAGYYRQLSETWRFNAALGIYTGSGDVSNGTGMDILAGVNKTYRRSEIGLDFDQGRSFNGFITNQATDRTDLLVRVHWTERFITSSSASYFTTTGGPTVSGTYETIQMRYVLTPHVSLIADGSYVQQTGNSVFVLGSKQYLGSVGIRWDAAPSPVY